jgi:hypothetical protein
MYETKCYVGGKIANLGTDAVVEEPSREDVSSVESLLARYLDSGTRQKLPPAADFKKVVAGRKLWNFDKREWKTWQEAL